MRSLLLAAVLLCGARAAAQCTATVTVVPFGTPCSSVFSGNPPALTGAFDAPSCTVSLTVTAFGGCCNTYLTNHILSFGLARTNLPVPWLGAGCALYTQPLVLLPLGRATNTLRAQLPLGIPRGNLYVQGAAVYFTTIGFSTDYALTGGLELQVR